MTVEKSLDMGKYAEVKASPIASVQAGGVYVYFTCNKTPGALYCFNQSTGEVAEIYTPSGSNANYCTASVIADARGNLYYTNRKDAIPNLGLDQPATDDPIGALIHDSSVRGQIF